jgi:hypothetical protein
MTDAYVEWSLAMEEKGLGGEYEQPEESVVEDTEPVWVVDLFCTLHFFHLFFCFGR